MKRLVPRRCDYCFQFPCRCDEIDKNRKEFEKRVDELAKIIPKKKDIYDDALDKLKRYSRSLNYITNVIEMEEKIGGDWVKFEDVKKMIEHLKEKI